MNARLRGWVEMKGNATLVQACECDKPSLTSGVRGAVSERECSPLPFFPFFFSNGATGGAMMRSFIRMLLVTPHLAHNKAQGFILVATLPYRDECIGCRFYDFMIL